MKVYYLLVLFCFSFVAWSSAQTIADSSTIWHVFANGYDYYGQIVERNADEIKIRTDVGEITIKTNDIRTLRPARQMRSSKIRLDGQENVSHFLAPSGYGLQKGEGYYQNTLVFANQGALGLTNHISMEAGIIPIPFTEEPVAAYWVNPKVSFPVVKDLLNIGLGSYVGSTINDDLGGLIVTPYTVATIGGRSTNATLGAAWVYNVDEWLRKPLFMVGGIAPVSKSSFIVSENYYIPKRHGSSVILSIGIRHIARKMSFDIGIFKPLDNYPKFPLPWFNIKVPFRYSKHRETM